MRGDIRVMSRALRDNFDELHSIAGSAAVLEVLARLFLPQEIGMVMRRQTYWLTPPFGRTSSLSVLQRLFRAGAYLGDRGVRADRRRPAASARMPDHRIVDLLKRLATDGHCSLAVLQELGGTPTILARWQ
jgi:hypothetical protein